MARKKNYTPGDVYTLTNDTTDNPKLWAKVLTDGRESLFLQYYLGYRMEFDEETDTKKIKHLRKKKSLGLYLWQTPRTQQEREENRKTLELAKKIRFEEGQKLLNDTKGYRVKTDSPQNFYDLFDKYISTYTKADIRVLKRAKEVFRECLQATPEYRHLSDYMKPEQLTKDIITAYVEYLQTNLNGETPHTYYARFKKVINWLIDKEFITKNPTKGIRIIIDTDTLKKEVLSIDEMQKLISTHYKGQNPNIRRAFIFSLQTGIRYCDVKELTFANIDYSNRLLKFEQQKTKGHSTASGVIIPLSDTLIKFIGTPPDGDRTALIFPLPSHTMCLKALRVWTKKAGIDKHITWHCARHSLGTNLIANGENPLIVSKILGHTDLKMTEKYIRVSDQLKREALANLPELQL
ncbi:MAG: site-specific integrase [Bacteroides sp.]|nr:site-specific integrase [Bacteroides sp.]